MRRHTETQHAKTRKVRVTGLIRRGAQAEMPLKEKGGLLVFDPPRGRPKVTAHQVKRLAEEW